MSEARKREVAALFEATKNTPVARVKRSEGLRQAWARKSPEERRAIGEKSAEKQRGVKVGPMPEETRRKIAEAQRRKWASGTRKPSQAAPTN
jgi:hypothetical protein